MIDCTFLTHPSGLVLLNKSSKAFLFVSVFWDNTDNTKERTRRENNKILFAMMLLLGN